MAEYKLGDYVELTLWDIYKIRGKIKGRITKISEKLRDGKEVWRIWINDDVYFLREFRERVSLTKSGKANNLCLIVEERD